MLYKSKCYLEDNPHNLSIMQPQQTQNMITTTNKKKKYTQQSPSSKQLENKMFQLPNQINKPFSTISILKTHAPSAHLTQYHHPQLQSYANFLNRTLPPSIVCNNKNILNRNNLSVNSIDSDSPSNFNNSGISHSILLETDSSIVPGHINTDIVKDSSENSNGIRYPACGSCGVNLNCNKHISTLNNCNARIPYGISFCKSNNFLYESGAIGVNFGSSEVRKHDTKKILNNYQIHKEYVTTTGNGNGANIRTSQQPVFRGPPAASPTPRTGPRQVSMQNMCQQQMHPSFVLPYGTYAQRQPSFQNAQGYSYPHSTVPHQGFFYPNQVFMQAPITHRGAIGVNPGVSGGMVQSGAAVPIPGPSGNSQTSIPIAAPVVAAPQGGTVLGVAATPQVAATSLMGIVPSAMASHPQQPSKQPKSHPNRLKIIDPNTNKNILDDFEPKPSSVQPSLHPDYSLPTTTSSQDSSLSVGSGVIVMQDPRQNMSFNMGLMADIHQTQSQREIVTHTPVVSAITDSPSIEILPATSKNRPKKIPIIPPKEDIGEKNNPTSFEEDTKITSEDEESVTANSTSMGTQAGDQNNAAESGSEKSSFKDQEKGGTESIDESNFQQFPSKDMTEELEFATGKKLDDLDNVCSIDLENVPINSETDLVTEIEEKRSDSLPTENDSVSNLCTKIDSEEIFPTTSLSTQINNDNDNLESCALHTDISPGQESVMCIELKNDSYVDQTADSNSLETKSENISNETQVSACINCEPDVGNKPQLVTKPPEADTDVTDKASQVTVKENETLTMENKKEQQDESEKCALDETKPSQILQYLIKYKDGQWSPTNPSGKKQYNREQLLQLREAKASQIQPPVKNPSILPQNNLMPNFVQKNHKRVQSMIGSIGSSRGGDGNAYGGKQSSMSGPHNRNSCKGDKIQINLSINQDVKLNETDNAWKPRVLQKKGEKTEADPVSKNNQEREELIRKVRGILNKLTPEKFETLVEEIFKLKVDTPDKMQDVMVLVFEKAIDEPNFSVSYANLCHRLITEVKARDERLEKGTKSNLAQFRIALIDKTEKEFNQNVTGSAAKELKLKPIIEKIKKCSDPNEKAELEMLLEEEERKIRRRSVGTVRFIGELFKISVLTGKIIYSCIENLLRGYNEDLLECLCKLLTTVGSKFEKTLRTPKEDPKTMYSLDKTITRMQAIANKTDKEGAKISSRVRFMLQDVIDLRKKNWQMTRNEAPKTMEQIEKDAKAAHYLNSIGSSSGSSSSTSHMGTNNKRDERSNRYGDSRYGGSHSQRGDTGSLRRQAGSSTNNSYSSGQGDESVWQVQTGKGSRITIFDTNKLEMMATQNLETKHLGNLNQFVWNKDIRQSIRPSNSFAPLSSLGDSKNNELDRERERSDRGGTRSKGSYNKNSLERDKYGGLNSRSLTGRENSSSRNSQSGLRGVNNSSSMQKSTSQSKYTQQIPPRLSAKATQPIPSFSQDSNTSVQVSDLSKPDGLSNSKDEITFNELSKEETKIVKTVITDMVESVSETKQNFDTIVKIFQDIKPAQYCGFIYYLLTDYLHLGKVGQLQRNNLSNIFLYLLSADLMKIDHFKLSYKHFCKLASDLLVDIPELWVYIFDFCGPLLSRKYINLNDLWIKELAAENENSNCSLGKKFLKSYLNCCIREIGPNFTRCMWKKYNMKWTDFLLEKQAHEFIVANKFEFIENELKTNSIVSSESSETVMAQVLDRIELMLKEESKAESIIDYINGNIGEFDKMFIKNLTTKLCKFALSEENYKLDIESFSKVCLPILQRCIDGKEELELECLLSMQILVNNLEHPRGLLSELFGELYYGDVMPQDAFLKWRDSKDQSAGKGVAVKGLHQFFFLLASESSDENV